MAESGNVTSNTSATDENKVGVSKKRLKSAKVNDELVKGGKAMTGSPIDKIEMNPVQEAAGEHTAVTNLNMRAQPVHKGHAKVIKAVEDEAKRVGGSAHIVTSHSEGDEKNPIPTAKKVGYLKKVAAPGTHVTSTSREAFSPLHTAARLNRHAHHLVVVAGSDRAGEYEKLLNKYNGKEGPHGHYNFKSITVKKIDRDPDAEGTKGVSGTKMREHAKNGDISKFKAGLPSELHQHAEEMMGDINRASKKKVKEDLDDLFNATFIDMDDTQEVLRAIEEAYDKADTSKREWGTTSLTKTYKGDTPGEKFGKNREAVPRSGQDRKNIDLTTRQGEDRKKDDRPYRLQAITKRRVDVDEAYGKGYKSPWDKIEKAKPGIGKRIDDAAAAVKQSAADYQKILDREAEEKKKKANEAFEQIDEISKELVGRVNKLRTLGPDIMKGTPPKPHKSQAAADTLRRAVDKVRFGSKVGAPPKVEEAKKMYKCPVCGAPVEKKGMNCGACHENMHEEKKRGLWDNIWAKRKRIAHGSGEHMRKPGSKGAPTNKDFKAAQESFQPCADCDCGLREEMVAEAAVDSKGFKSSTGGLTQKGRDHYNHTTGSHLKAPVTKKPSQLKKGSKAANRRKSFCARMGGMKKRLTSSKTAHDPNSRINKALRKWNC
jgi:hypothetical protein